MANPQPDQFTKLSNEILEQLALTRIPGEARQVFDFIMRKTWGWRQPKSTITLKQFYAGTGLSRSSVCRAINKLLSMNIIDKKVNGNSVTYWIQKDYDKWKRLRKSKYLLIRQQNVDELVNGVDELVNAGRRTNNNNNNLQTPKYTLLKTLKERKKGEEGIFLFNKIKVRVDKNGNFYSIPPNEDIPEFYLGKLEEKVNA